MVLWALALAFLSVANLLLLSAVVQVTGSNDAPSSGQVWVVFFLNIIFLIGFMVSAYGLFRLYNWARILFLGCITVWSVFNLIALFIPSVSPEQDYSIGELTLNGLRYGVGLFLPWWYLNVPHVKAIFYRQPAENETSEEM
ncbi:MAG: hypothetical protein JXM69_20315 [Anaerolineae bacterium]|nr:hypothetical protein [Anaerolineae bacterium]